MKSSLPLQKIFDNHQSIDDALALNPDTKEIIKLSKQLKKISVQYEIANNLRESINNINQNQDLAKDTEDSELIEMLNAETDDLKTKVIDWEEELLAYMSPSDPRDDNDIFIEIRAGAGGDEASLFVGELIKTYSIMCSELGLTLKLVDVSAGTVGGYKEVIAEIRGDGSYSWFKYEGGVHRVQRVPETEKQGRVHTSTISVAIMPLIEETDGFKLHENDVEVVATTSQGAGGQSVNTTYSAVIMTHKPTGIKAKCQDERSFRQNKEKCWQILTARVFDHLEQVRQEKESNERKEQVGRADRSEKIRTYNFPQDRVTDHRYNQNWNQLPNIMNGQILKVIQDIKKLEAKRILDTLSE